MSSHRILILDDSINDCRILKTLFQMEFPWIDVRYELKVQPVDEIIQWDAVILDFNGRTFMGDELAAKIFEARPDMPGMVLTDYAEFARHATLPRNWRMRPKGDFYQMLPPLQEWLEDYGMIERRKTKRKH